MMGEMADLDIENGVHPETDLMEDWRQAELGDMTEDILAQPEEEINMTETESTEGLIDVRGNLSVLAKTAGIKLSDCKEFDENTWINPTPQAKKDVLEAMDELKKHQGDPVIVLVNKDNNYMTIKLDTDEKQRQEEERKNSAPEAEAVPVEVVSENEVVDAQRAVAVKPTQEVTGSDLVPKFEISVSEAESRMNDLNQFIGSQMVEHQDYGVVPGMGTKATLFKSGAEKLENIHGFFHKFTEVEKIVDYKQEFVLYRYRCEVFHKKTGLKQAECIGSSNNREKSNKGKDFYSVLNTIDKMAQKRAFVGAILNACRVSSRFTQDIEDLK